MDKVIECAYCHDDETKFCEYCNDKVKVCAYCRVSTDDENQLNSLENQTYYFNKNIEKNEKYELTKIYADEGLTATSWKKRKYFQEMLIDAGLDIEVYRKEIKAYVGTRKPKFNRILIKDVSRFSRNASEGLELVTKLREKGVHIDFVSLGLSTDKMTNDMIIGFFLLAAENDSKDKSVKVLWGKRVGAEKGVIMTADKFYGYKYHKDTKELEIIEHEAEVIRLIYDLYANHELGFRKIISYLTDHNIFTRAGKPFAQQTLSRMLQNEAYTGKLIRNKMDAPKVFTSKTYATVKPKDEWIITNNRIPKIISEELYQKAQEIRKSKINYKKKIGKNVGTSEYAGLIKCGICGTTFTKNSEVRTGVAFYNCKKKKLNGKKACTSPNVTLKQIEETIDALSNGGLYNALIRDRDTHIENMYAKIELKKLKLDKQDIEEVISLKADLSEHEEENKRLNNLYIKGKLSEDDYEEYQKDVLLRIEESKALIAEKSKSNDIIEHEIKEIHSTIDNLRNIESKPVYSKEEVKDQLKMLTIYYAKDNKSAHINIKLNVFDTLNEIVNQ